MSKPLHIGLIGCGFMGRAHSNAYHKVNHFFDLAYRPVLRAACARDPGMVKAFADKWGFESVETDWRKLVERRDIDVVDICRIGARFSAAAACESLDAKFGAATS